MKLNTSNLRSLKLFDEYMTSKNQICFFSKPEKKTLGRDLCLIDHQAIDSRH